MRRLLTIGFLTLSICYVALVLAAFVFQRSLLFPVPRSAREPRHARLVRSIDGGVTMGLTLPVLVVHGTADEVVPTAMGERLAREFAHCELMLVEGAHHNDLIDRAEVLERISSFVQR